MTLAQDIQAMILKASKLQDMLPDTDHGHDVGTALLIGQTHLDNAADDLANGQPVLAAAMFAKGQDIVTAVDGTVDAMGWTVADQDGYGNDL